LAEFAVTRVRAPQFIVILDKNQGDLEKMCFFLNTVYKNRAKTIRHVIPPRCRQTCRSSRHLSLSSLSWSARQYWWSAVIRPRVHWQSPSRHVIDGLHLLSLPQTSRPARTSTQSQQTNQIKYSHTVMFNSSLFCTQHLVLSLLLSPDSAIAKDKEEPCPLHR